MRLNRPEGHHTDDKFLIPMRGNEVVVDEEGNTEYGFLIPMRGNEVPPILSHDPNIEFLIPMRGNEFENNDRGPWTLLIPNPHEG